MAWVTGLNASTQLINDYRELHTEYRKKLKTKLKKEYIRELTRCEEAGEQQCAAAASCCRPLCVCLTVCMSDAL